MANSLASRRRFLCSAATSAVATPLLRCSAAGTGPAAIGQVDAGLVSDYPVDSLEPIGDLPVVLGRDADGFYAMTLTCSHEGCNMARFGRVDAHRIHCNCHGAQFDENGEVLSGPAQMPLVHFAVSVDATTGRIVIDGDHEVGSDDRTSI